MREVVDRVMAAFEPARDAERAASMAAYMKQHFPFLGIAAPLRRSLQREAFRSAPEPDSVDELIRTATEFWTLPEREYQYAGMEWLDKHSNLFEASHLGALAHFVVTKSWWDTVDDLCRHPIGDTVRRHPKDGRMVMDQWLAGNEMWLQRSAILHMERWRGEMDQQWLFEACRQHAHRKEFFIRKAIGWALRSHAHHSADNAAAVRAFVTNYAEELSGLSRTEALKRVRH